MTYTCITEVNEMLNNLHYVNCYYNICKSEHHSRLISIETARRIMLDDKRLLKSFKINIYHPDTCTLVLSINNKGL